MFAFFSECIVFHLNRQVHLYHHHCEKVSYSTFLSKQYAGRLSRWTRVPYGVTWEAYEIG